jgi:RNA polymerase sigma-70 factor, ECF subfamily
MGTEAGKFNRDKLAGIYEEYYDKVALYIYSRISDKSEAEDLASEVFLKALESIKTYREEGVPIQAWLFRITRNLIIDRYRRTAKYRTVPIEGMEIRSDSDPAATAAANIEIERVKTAMQHLTEQQREVVRLRFFGGLTSQEVAGILGKSHGAVREMQSAALDKLRQLLGEDRPQV